MNWLIFINSIILANALESRVFHGEELRPEEHGHLVRLSIHGSNDGMCSGSIISPNWIVSSAHCFKFIVSWVNVTQSTRAGFDAPLATVPGNNIHKHPDYIDFNRSISNLQNDIAVLETRRPIKFKPDYIQPIKLTRCTPKVGASVVIAGYGDSELMGMKPIEAVLQTVSCPSYWPALDVLCTDASPGKAHGGSGDSGGPLVWKGRLVGVTSARLCSEYSCTYPPVYDIFASIAVNKNWIKSVTKI